MSCEMPEGVSDTQGLSAWLSAQNEALGLELAKPGNRLSINQRLVTGHEAIKDGDEIAFMSPLSGG